MNWKRLLLAIGIAILLFGIGIGLIKLIHWINANHPNWFMYAVGILIFTIITFLIYDILDFKDRPIRKGGKPNLW